MLFLERQPTFDQSLMCTKIRTQNVIEGLNNIEYQRFQSFILIVFPVVRQFIVVVDFVMQEESIHCNYRSYVT